MMISRCMAAAFSLLIIFMPKADAADGFLPVATIQASASKEVLQDQVQVVMGTRVTAQTAGQANQMLTEALAQSRQGLEVPAGVLISSGRFSTFPAYDKEGVVTGWAGTASLVIDSEDLQAVAAVIEYLGKSLAVSSIQFSLSASVRQATEQALMQDLAQTFGQRASVAARAFGFEAYDLMALDFDRADMASRPMMRMASAPMMADAGPAVSLEPSMTTVEISVVGQIQLR